MAKTEWEILMDSDGDKKFDEDNSKFTVQGPILNKILVHMPQLIPTYPPTESTPLQVLEVASGTGQHAAYFGKKLQNVIWIPTDYDQKCITSTDLWTQELDAKVQRCKLLDVTSDSSLWPVPPDSVDVIYNSNMIHLAPEAVMHGFFAGAGLVARAGAKLFIYGPFLDPGNYHGECNAELDQKLKARDPTWGVRDLAEVKALLWKNGFEFIAKEIMPHKNFLLVFQKVLDAKEGWEREKQHIIGKTEPEPQVKQVVVAQDPCCVAGLQKLVDSLRSKLA